MVFKSISIPLLWMFCLTHKVATTIIRYMVGVYSFHKSLRKTSFTLILSDIKFPETEGRKCNILTNRWKIIFKKIRSFSSK